MELSRLNCIYKSGLDRNGRTVVVCNMAPLVAAQPAHHHVLLHFIDFFDGIVSQKFSVIYLHDDIPADYRPSYKWLKAIHVMLIRKYHKNLQNLFVFNSSIWLKTALAFVVPPTNNLWKTKLYFLEKMEDLHACIDPNQILIEPYLVKPLTGANALWSSFRNALGS